MDSFLITKFAGTFFVSLLLLMGINEVGNMLVKPTPLPDKAVVEDVEYAVEMATEETDTGEEIAGAQTVDQTLGEEEAAEKAEAAAPTYAQLLQDASAEAGAKVARKCKSCHVMTKGGANRVGPAMWNIVGAEIAGRADYSYSKAMAAMEGTWGYEELDAYISQPKEYVPGTKMSFAGIKDADDRANLIVYLRSLSDAPLPLPVTATE